MLRKSQRKILQRAAIVSGLLLVNCQTLPDVKPYEPKKHCDGETMAHAETMPSNGKIEASKAKRVVEALRECGRYTHEIASHNTAAADDLKDKTSRFQPFKDWLLTFETAVLIAAAIIAAL